MLLAMIHNKYHSLTETEKRIASCILRDPGRVSAMTAKELADQCQTVPSAVIRFCKSIGVSGFSQLKLDLAREAAVRDTETRETVENLPAFCKEDDTQTIFHKVFASGIRTLKDTLAMLDFQQIEGIVEVISKAKNVYIFGVGTSSTVAIDAGYRFAQFGIRAHACTDLLFMNVIAGNMTPGDVALGISHGGRTKAVVDAMRRAKEAGASTVALTSFADSTLCTESDYAISVYADEKNYPVEAVSARVAHICVIDALMMALGTRNSEDFEKHISIRNAALKDIRY